jgi:hypothetical protein
MKLYIQNFSTYRSDRDEVNIKATLKKEYHLETRRQSEFIHLAVYGGQLLKDKISIDPSDALYMTSANGDIDVVQRSNTYVNKEKQAIKLFDFINLLGNTSSYYVAKSLGIHGKNIFQISNHFTYIHTLISLYSSLYHSQTNAILCAVDLAPNPEEIAQRVLGIEENTSLVSSVNYQKFSLQSKDAMAVLEFDTRSYTLEEMKTILASNRAKVHGSIRCKALLDNDETSFFETMPSAVLNEAMKQSNDIIYIDCYDEKYKILKLKNLR